MLLAVLVVVKQHRGVAGDREAESYTLMIDATAPPWYARASQEGDSKTRGDPTPMRLHTKGSYCDRGMPM